jgi:excisionase family DNA binding protein
LPRTVRNWKDRKELPAVRVGQLRVRMRRSDLDAFLTAGVTGRPDPPSPKGGGADLSELGEQLADSLTQAQAPSRTPGDRALTPDLT